MSSDQSFPIGLSKIYKEYIPECVFDRIIKFSRIYQRVFFVNNEHKKLPVRNWDYDLKCNLCGFSSIADVVSEDLEIIRLWLITSRKHANYHNNSGFKQAMFRCVQEGWIRKIILVSNSINFSSQKLPIPTMFAVACEYGHLEIVNWLYAIAPTECAISINGCIGAFKSGYTEILNFKLSKLTYDERDNYNKLMNFS